MALPDNFELVAEVGRFDYDWDGVFVYRNTDTRRLHAVHEAGCSCFGPGEEIDASDLIDVVNISDLEPLVAELYDEPTANELLDFKNAVRAELP